MWDARASVRSRPRRLLQGNDELLFFPPDLFPAVKHPLVVERGSRTVGRMLAQRLVDYLDFTAELEQRAVNPVCASISRGRCGVALPDQMREDAFKIYTDEAWHAQFSDDLRRQVAARAGLETSTTRLPQFIGRLERMKADTERRYHGVLDLFFSIVSETLISSTLASIPSDVRIAPAVREVFADHAIDEGVHHVYFAKVLEFAWRQLSASERWVVVDRLPQMILAFLEPDVPALADLFYGNDLGYDDVGQLIVDCYAPDDVLATVRREGGAAMRHFANVGVLDSTQAQERFAEAGLVVPS